MEPKKRGRKGIVKDDPIAEARRLKLNESSRRSKAKKLQREKELRKQETGEDKYGIRPVDERRYNQCFTAGYIGMPVSLGYVRSMTGLSNTQIFVMQKRTGLYPTPAITLNSVVKDVNSVEYI